MRTFVVATSNQHKVDEIAAILRGFPVELKSLREFGITGQPEENGASYLENALLKARHYCEQTGMPCLADDSGLEVDALDGRPGLHSARFAGASTPHSEKILRVLELLREVPDLRRGARFRCVAALVGPGGLMATAEGVCEGRIAHRPSGANGFGYDPIFLLPDRGCTTADLDTAEKNRISHRARAFLGLMAELDIAPEVD